MSKDIPQPNRIEELETQVENLKSEICKKNAAIRIWDDAVERNRFAMAVAGKFEGRYDYTNDKHFSDYAEITYKLADALLAESKKRQKEVK